MIPKPWRKVVNVKRTGLGGLGGRRGAITKLECGHTILDHGQARVERAQDAKRRRCPDCIAKTIDRVDVTNTAMVAGNETRINKVNEGGRLRQWVGFGWIDLGPPDPKFPTVR